MISKDNILLLGIGEAGGRIVNEILAKDKRYIGLFINTSYQDVLKLSNAKNIYTIPNADGTGRRREVAANYLKDYANTIVDQIDKFPLQHSIYMAFSLGGGTGSGMSIPLIRLLGRLRPQKKINIIGILPHLDESKRAKQNSIDCWNDLVKTPNINLSFILDNNKRKNKEEINAEFAERFDAMMDISKSNIENVNSNVIDKADANVLLSVKGSAAIYLLPKDVSDTKVAIAKAINDSIFADYSRDICSYLGVSLLPDSPLKRNVIVNEFNPTEDKFIEGENDKYNLVVATGYSLGLQKGAIELLDISISESEIKKTQEYEIDDLIIGDKPNKPIAIAKEESIHSINIKQQKQNLDNALDDDDLWNDIMNM